MNSTLALIVDDRSGQLSQDAELLSGKQIFVISSDCDQASSINFLETVETDFIGFISSAEFRSIAHTPSLPLSTRPFLAAWRSPVTLPIETAAIASATISAWIASTELVQSTLKQRPIDRWTLLEIADVLEQANIEFDWRTLPTQTSLFDSTSNSTVLALVPHYRCEIWLRRCLRSLVNQTRPPDGIVVIDDASEHPPIEIVAEFPTVTLLASDRHVGPYRLIQQVIEMTNYWAYLFQDADDWSSCDRLEKTDSCCINNRRATSWNARASHL